MPIKLFDPQFWTTLSRRFAATTAALISAGSMIHPKKTSYQG
jgi:hypothetical protein